MASVKIATLLIRTVAKPISAQLKNQAKQHETFRRICVRLAQRMHATEVKLRTNILGEPAKHVRPLSETRAIENGANALAEGFLFTVAASLILGEAYRSSRSQSRRREGVDDQIEELVRRVDVLSERMEQITGAWEEERRGERERNDELSRILERVVEIGLRGGWAEFEGTPLQFPRIQLSPHRSSPPSLPPAVVAVDADQDDDARSREGGHEEEKEIGKSSDEKDRERIRVDGEEGDGNKS